MDRVSQCLSVTLPLERSPSLCSRKNIVIILDIYNEHNAHNDNFSKTALLTQDVVLTSIQRQLNVMDVR